MRRWQSCLDRHLHDHAHESPRVMTLPLVNQNFTLKAGTPSTQVDSRSSTSRLMTVSVVTPSDAAVKLARRRCRRTGRASA